MAFNGRQSVGSEFKSLGRRAWTFRSDGRRILGFGRQSADGLIEQWTNSTVDAVWVPLRLQGELNEVDSGQAQPFLLAGSVLSRCARIVVGNAMGPDGAAPDPHSDVKGRPHRE